MLSWTRIGLLTIMSVGCFMFCEEALAMAWLGTDENGHEVRVYDAKKYLKENPDKPPVKKKALAPKPKKTLNPKPKAPSKLDEAAINRLIDKKLKDKEKKKEEESKKFKVEKAISAAVIGGGGTALAGTIVPGLGTMTGIVSGAVGGVATYAAKWAYINSDDVIEGYKKISKIEDPMGRWNP